MVSLERTIIDLFNEKVLDEDMYNQVSDKFFGYSLLDSKNLESEGSSFGVGTPIKPMMAKLVGSSEDAFKFLSRGKCDDAYVELKLDGERIQAHWDSEKKDMNFFSRSTECNNAKYKS